MALTIEELLINLGVDVTSFKSNLAVAEKSLVGVATAGDRVKASLGGIEDVTTQLEGSLAPVTTTASKVAQSVGTIGTATKNISFKELGSASALAASNLRNIGTASTAAGAGIKSTGASAALTDGQLKALNASGGQLSKTLTLIALNGGVSASQLIGVGKNLKDLAVGAGAVAAANPSGVLARIATSAAGIAPVLGPAAVAFVAFQVVLRRFNQELSKEQAKIDEFNKKGAAAVGNFQDRADAIKFETSAVGLNETEKAIARITAELKKEQDQGKLTASQVDQLIALEQGRLNELNFDKAKTESQAAGRALQDNIRAGVDAALVEIDKLNAGFEVKPAEVNLAALQSLGKELDFEGPISQLQDFQQKLDANAAKVREIAAEAGLLPEAIEKMVKESNGKLKNFLKEEIKLKVAVDTADAERTFPAALAKLNASPPVIVKTELNVAQLLAHRSTILSKIAADPYNIELRADLKQVDGQIAAKRAEEQGNPVVIPVDADTSRFSAAIDDAARRAADNLAAALDAVSGKSKTVGDAASVGELQSSVDQLRSDVVSAIESGDAAQLVELRKNATAFANSFGVGLPSAIRNQINSLVGGLSPLSTALNLLGATSLGVGGGALGGDAATTALNELKETLAQKLDEQTAVQRENIDATREGTDATVQLGNALGSGRFAQGMLSNLRRATGDRGLFWGG